MLMDWRDQVVRDDDRYIELNGQMVEKSLTGTCLGCHENKDASCDRCHDYMGVRPYCWDCHVDPKGGR